MSVELPVINLNAASGVALESPFHDTTAYFLDFVGKAQKSVHIIDFGFHLPPLTDLLVKLWDDGLPSMGLILDHSQAQGKPEAGELLKLLQGSKRGPVPYLISVSPRSGQLVHIKTTIVDERWVELGSWNYSQSAPDQVNDLVIIESEPLAHMRLLMFDVLRAYAVRHERIFQPHAEVVPAVALAEDVGRDAQLDPAPRAGQVHRKDVAAPWLDNPPIVAPAPAGARDYPKSNEVKPRVRKRKVRA